MSETARLSDDLQAEIVELIEELVDFARQDVRPPKIAATLRERISAAIASRDAKVAKEAIDEVMGMGDCPRGTDYLRGYADACIKMSIWLRRYLPPSLSEDSRDGK